MESRSFYNTILTEHNLHPLHKQVLKDANLALEGVNPSCGDDIVLQLKVEDGKSQTVRLPGAAVPFRRLRRI